MCKVATFLATTGLLLVVSIISSNAGSVVGSVAENNNSRVLESKKKRAKEKKKTKSSKVSKTKSEKKKGKKAKGTNIQSNSPFSPFGPVNATIAVRPGTGATRVQAAVEDVSVNTILQQPLRKLQEAPKVEHNKVESDAIFLPESDHRMLQTPPINTIGDLKVIVILNNCDCTLFGPTFSTPDACECYETTISGTATRPGLASLLLTASLENGTFGLRMNQIIPNSAAKPPFEKKAISLTNESESKSKTSRGHS